MSQTPCGGFAPGPHWGLVPDPVTNPLANSCICRFIQQALVYQLHVIQHGHVVASAVKGLKLNSENECQSQGLLVCGSKEEII